MSSLCYVLSFSVYVGTFVFPPDHSHSNVLNFTHLSIFSLLPRRPAGFSLFKLTSCPCFPLRCFFWLPSALCPSYLGMGLSSHRWRAAGLIIFCPTTAPLPDTLQMVDIHQHVSKWNLHETRKKNLQPQECILVFLEVRTDQNVNIHNLV